MKYIFIFFLAFILAGPALAAHVVGGSVPEVQSLQPPPVGIAPNVHSNIQNTDTLFGNEHAPNNDNNATGSAVSQNPEVVSAAQKHSSGLLWRLFLFVCFAAAAVIVGIAIKHRHE